MADPTRDILFGKGDVIVTKDVHYKVLEILGRGGAGCVYKVINSSLDSPCVLKLMHRSSASNPEARARFDKDALISAKIGAHPNLVTVNYKSNLPDGTPFHIMEYAHGLSVRALLKERADGRIPLAIAVKIAADVLQGLAFMHRRGVIHRDIKPDNVLYVETSTGDTAAKIIDFDAAWILENPAQSELMFTPKYAAPEQFALGRLSPKIDTFSATALLFEMLTGETPYERFGRSFAEQVKRVNVPAPILSDYGDFSELLIRGVLGGLVLVPAVRSTPLELLHVLEEIGNELAAVSRGNTVLTQPDLLPPQSERPPMTRADMAGATDPGPPPNMTDPGGVPFDGPIVQMPGARTQPMVHLTRRGSRSPNWRAEPTADFDRMPPLRRPRNAGLDGTVSLSTAELLRVSAPDYDMTLQSGGVVRERPANRTTPLVEPPRVSRKPTLRKRSRIGDWWQRVTRVPFVIFLVSCIVFISMLVWRFR